MKFSSKVFLMLIIATFQQNSIHAVPFRDLKESAKNKVSLVRSKIDSGYNKTKQFIKNNPKKVAAGALALWTAYGYNAINKTILSTKSGNVIKCANCNIHRKLIAAPFVTFIKLLHKIAKLNAKTINKILNIKSEN
ncbi:hypothetical protein M1446_02510 [Candidatus Dependentiae bacterium]|nr:hypothetical protein [Candidatus Dependentiae bacterium]